MALGISTSGYTMRADLAEKVNSLADANFNGNRSAALTYIAELGIRNTPKDVFDFNYVGLPVPYKTFLRKPEDSTKSQNIQVSKAFKIYVTSVKDKYDTTASNVFQVSILMYLSMLLGASRTPEELKANIVKPSSRVSKTDRIDHLVTLVSDEIVTVILDNVAQLVDIKMATLIRHLLYSGVPVFEDMVVMQGNISEEQINGAIKQIKRRLQLS